MEQMKKLNGTDDMTLLAFCMTLSDPIEIKQCIKAYIGLTSQVNNFVSECINHNRGDPRSTFFSSSPVEVVHLQIVALA